MADTVWTSIKNAIVASLQGILTTGGYNTNAGSNVFLWRKTRLPLESLPALCVYDKEEETEDELFDIQENVKAVSIECVASDEDEDSLRATLEDMLADVMKAIGVDETWGNKAVWTKKIGSVPEIEREKEYAVGTLRVDLLIRYRHTRWDVYTVR